MEQKLLERYQLRTLDPKSWDQDTVVFNSESNSQLQGYKQLLEEVAKDDPQNLPQLLNPIDPLNPQLQIRTVLKQHGITNLTDDDVLKLSIGSKKFNSKVYLTLNHLDDLFDELVRSLNLLENSIEDQEGELKRLIQQEYLKFVRSKTSLDDVLGQFQQKGFGVDQEEGDGDANMLKNLRISMNEANKETAVLIKPIISSKVREDKLVKAIEFVEKKRFFFDLPKNLKSSLQANDYDDFIRDYRKGKNLRDAEFEEADDLAVNVKVIDRIWESVELIVDSYKKQLWTALSNDKNDLEFLKIIKRLIELGEIDNPILEWIELKNRALLARFNEAFSRYHDKILNVQLNIIYTISQQSYTTFRSVLHNDVQLLDYTSIVEMWLMITKLLGEINMIIQDFIRFWTHAQTFIEGGYTEKLISNYVPQDHQFLNFQNYEIQEIISKGAKFIKQIIHKLLRFFTSTQESLKQLGSSNLGKEGNSSTLNNGDFSGPVKEFGFVPPYTNSLSALRYLPLISNKTFRILNDLGQLTITDKITQELRETAEIVTERIIGAVCATWINDCQNFHKLEDWSRLPTGETSIPSLILDYETFVVEKLGDLLLKNIPNSNNNVTIVRYPSKKYLTGVQTQFLRSFDTLLQSIIQKIISESHSPSMNLNVRNTHKLLTFFNLERLTEPVVPEIVAKFDSIFSTKMQNEKLEIYSILEKMKNTIFDSYMNDQKKAITNILTKSMSVVDWANSNVKVTKVSAPVYETLNVLISVYIGVLSVSQELTVNIFHPLLEHSSAVLLTCFRDVSDFNDYSFKQAVLDIEFFKGLIGNSANEGFTNNFKLIYKNFQAAQLDIRDAYQSIGDILDESLKNSTLEYEIFNN